MAPTTQRQDSELFVVPTATLDAASSSIDPTKPVFMLNLLHFRDRAVYSPSDPEEFKNLPTVSGRDAFRTRYVPAFSEVVAAEGMATGDGEGMVVLWGKVVANLLDSHRHGAETDNTEKWDDVALIRYESYEKFRQLVEGKRYLRHAAPHRLAALE